MFVTLERSYCRSLASAIRDAIIVGVFPTWADARESADDCLSAVAVCTETGRVYFASGAETVLESIHEPSDAFDGMSGADYLAMRA